MNVSARRDNRHFSYLMVIAAYSLYVIIFAVFHTSVGDGIASLAIIPVIASSLYFGVRGGILTAMVLAMANIILRTFSGYTYLDSLTNPSLVVGALALLFLAVIVGRLATVTRERQDTFLQLEKLEKERRAHANFLEILNQITGTVLKSDDLESTLQILVDQIAVLFEANDCFFARWDEANNVTIPIVAFGPFRDAYPQAQFKPGEQTLTASILREGRPLVIREVKESFYTNPAYTSYITNQSMLGIPLIAQNQKLGSLILGYNESRSFDPAEISRAELVAEQIALVLLKSQLLEEAQKKLVELTTLHDVALASIQADNEDQLIERATEIIGRNLFLDNFGILLLDGNDRILRAHPSYRFISSQELHMMEVTLGRGVTGQVAETGLSLRIGNVDQVENYLKVDERISSELCVPIKIKDRVLGVINAESVKKDAFTVNDERLLTTLAGQLATAIEQMRKAQTERQWLDQLAHSNNLIYALAHITTHIEKALTPDEIFQTLEEELYKIQLTCVIALYNHDQRIFTINRASMESKVLERMEADIGFPLVQHVIPMDRLNSIVGETENLHDPVVIVSPENEIQVLFDHIQTEGIREILQGIGITSTIKLLRLPLVFEDNLLGILWAWGSGIFPSDLPIMSIFAKQIGTSLERARLFQEVQSLALTDPLTGLHNRRSLFELGKIEFSRAHRFHRPFCCLMLDLDHFKQINDTHGHQTGDMVLQEFAKRCKDSVREIDLIGRYGGEEVLILLPETEIETAVRMAERIRSAICSNPFSIANMNLNITASIGVSTKDDNTPALDTLVARADQAMYIAKHKGRNCVAVSK